MGKASAVANPNIALVQGSQLRAAWLRKIRTSAEREPRPEARDRRLRALAARESRLDELFALFEDHPLPARIGTDEQSLFVIGYHHQRAHDSAQRRAHAAAAADSETPTA